MNKKLIKASIAGAATLALAAGGSTFAAWSDFDTITGNTTEAGHLKIDLNSTGAISNVGGQAIAPGESRTIDFMIASADLDGVPLADLSMQVIPLSLTDLENGCGSTNSEAILDPTCATPGDPGEFSQQGYVRVRFSTPAALGDMTFANNSCTAPGGYVNSLMYAPANNNTSTAYPRLNAFAAAGNHALGQLSDGQGVCVRVDLGLDPTATNAVQSDSSTFDLQFDLVQS